MIRDLCAVTILEQWIGWYNYILKQWIEAMAMSFSEYDVTRRTRKENFLKQIDELIGWPSIGQAIAAHYAACSRSSGVFRAAAVQDAAGRILARRIKWWVSGRHGEFESTRDAISGIAVARWCTRPLSIVAFQNAVNGGGRVDGLLNQVNRQIQAHDIEVRKGYHVDTSITRSLRKHKTRPTYDQNYSGIRGLCVFAKVSSWYTLIRDATPQTARN